MMMPAGVGSDVPTISEFNRTCPVCGAADGIPRAVTAARGTFMVTLACTTCAHEWETERKPLVPLFTPWRQDPHHTP